jgi:Protein of unknown function (DUF4435)
LASGERYFSMPFIDVLRAARSSRVAILHEFLTQYDASSGRVHAFFEGHDDIAFFIPALKRYVAAGTLVIPYRCEGKARVYEAFSEITERIPGVRSVFFFVDKDLDDILGLPWPTDPRVFVTDVYSVENYLVARSTLTSLLRNAVRLRDVTFDEAVILHQFEEQLARFQRLMLPVMAWILIARRAGAKPNLANVSMVDICGITGDCEVRAARGKRLKALLRNAGVAETGSLFRLMRHTVKELRRLPPKRIVRGKFEAWFFVEFWKHLVRQLVSLAQESGGKATVKLTLEHGNFVPTLAAHGALPRSLELFLETHFPQAVPDAPPAQRRRSIQSWWQRLVTAGRRR